MRYYSLCVSQRFQRAVTSGYINKRQSQNQQNSDLNESRSPRRTGGLGRKRHYKSHIQRYKVHHEKGSDSIVKGEVSRPL